MSEVRNALIIEKLMGFVGCIVYSWDNASSKAIWNALKSQGVLADQIPCFKALITIHKLLVGGPHIVSIR